MGSICRKLLRFIERRKVPKVNYPESKRRSIDPLQVSSLGMTGAGARIPAQEIPPDGLHRSYRLPHAARIMFREIQPLVA